VTHDNDEQQVKDYYALLRLSGTNYDAITRQSALEKLLNFELYTKDVFKSLAYGSAHFRWRLARFCKEQIKALIENEEYKETFKNDILPQLPFKEKTVVERILTN